MPNRLASQTSPYLLQHANNPVDWYPWGEEALARARHENKPIFLSVGYAACHWCHVMEHESFEDPEIAAMMNRDFINIKVDREERPDIDSIYMGAVMAMTGSGGWPMSVFLTPEGRPFYGGTYFPPARRYGMPSFQEVLYSVAQTWKEAKGEVYRVADKLTGHLQESTRWGSGGTLEARTLQRAAEELSSSFNHARGGWGQAPLFPQPMTIEFLLQQATRGSRVYLPIVIRALEAMQRGGLWDVVAGGFHRYSTDERWLVPHFEKMLYDNAQLALAYLHAGLLAGRADFLDTCTRTLDFLQSEMANTEGGFFSSLDADSEGEEGKFYVWTAEELRAALPDPDDFTLLEQVYALPAGGNFEGKIILQRQQEWEPLAASMGMDDAQLRARLNAIHGLLLATRRRRVRPGTDDKVLTAWNGLALRAFAEAARFLQRGDYLETARRNADFLLGSLVANGQLMRAWRAGAANTPAFSEDHAALALGLLALYQADPQQRWFAAARDQMETLLANFEDPNGGFFNTRAAHGSLILRPKDMQDNATPSGNALAALALLELAELDVRPEWRAQAETLLSGMQEVAVQYPAAFGMWLQAMDFAAGPVREVALLTPPGDASLPDFLRAAAQHYQPRMVLAASSYPPEEAAPALLKDRPLLDGKLTAYVCEGFTCQLPVNDAGAFEAQVKGDLPASA